MPNENEQLQKLQSIIDYEFEDISLLRKAMTHSSLTPAGHRSYERLEFLGDAVAGLAVAQELFMAPPEYSEGEMTVMKSDTVNRHSMEQAGRRLELQNFVRMEHGLAQQEIPASLITDAYEALIGAIFLDGGYSAAQRFVLRTLQAELQAAEEREHPPNYKSILQEMLQAESKEPPTYHTARKVGPAHNVRFQAEVRLEAAAWGSGWGRTKKEAEQQAAREALLALYPDSWRSHCGLD